MNILEKVPFIESGKKKVQYLLDNYKRMGIYIKPVKYEDGVLNVLAEQKKYINDKILTASELTERVQEVFENKFDREIQLVITPIVDRSNELRSVNSEYVNSWLKQLDLKPSMVAKGLDLDKSTISLLLAGEREFTKPMRAAFYYYFKNQSFSKKLSQERATQSRSFK